MKILKRLGHTTDTEFGSGLIEAPPKDKEAKVKKQILFLPIF